MKKISSLLTLSLLYCNFASGITLTDSRLYVLNENISETVTIEVDNVTLDLNGYTISPSEGTDAIEVAEDLCNITIKNGNIVGTGTTDPSENLPSENGIYVEENCRLIKIENLNIRNFQNGINFEGIPGEEKGDPGRPIKACKVKDCVIKSCITGVEAIALWESNFENVLIPNFGSESDNSSGFSVENSQTLCFHRCQVSNPFHKGFLFKFISSTNCILKECSLNIDIETDTAGFDITQIYLKSCDRIKIIDCILLSGILETESIFGQENGIVLDESSRCILENNNIMYIQKGTFSDEKGIAINLSGGEFNTIHNNIINQCTGGIKISNSTNNTVYYNKIYNANYKSGQYAGLGTAIFADEDKNFIFKNISYNNDVPTVGPAYSLYDPNTVAPMLNQIDIETAVIDNSYYNLVKQD